MSIFDILGIGTAFAEVANTATNAANTAQQQSPAAGFLSMLPMLIIIVAVFYFLFVRPQTKRQKEQRALLDSLTIGDEVITTAGLIGRLTKLRDNYVVLNVGQSVEQGVEITLQKNAIVGVLPKGTLETLK